MPKNSVGILLKTFHMIGITQENFMNNTFRGKMVQAIQDYVKSLNFGYRVKLREKKVTYLNAFAKFVDPHTVECIKGNKVVELFFL